MCQRVQERRKDVEVWQEQIESPRGGITVGAAETSEALAKWRRPHRKNTGAAEQEREASASPREQLARTPEPPMSKGKGTEPPVRIMRL